MFIELQRMNKPQSVYTHDLFNFNYVSAKKLHFWLIEQGDIFKHQKTFGQGYIKWFSLSVLIPKPFAKASINILAGFIKTPECHKIWTRESSGHKPLQQNNRFPQLPLYIPR